MARQRVKNYTRWRGGLLVPGWAGSGSVSSQSGGDWTPYFATNFENDTIGQTPSGIGGTGDLVTNEEAYSGSRSWKLTIDEGEDSGFGGAVSLNPNLVRCDEFWIRLRTFWPVGSNYDSTSGGNRLKFLRLHVLTEGRDHIGYNDLYLNPQSGQQEGVFRFIWEGENSWIRDIGTAPQDSPQFGVWETYEYYVKLDHLTQGDGGDARVRVWKNGGLLRDITTRRTMNAATNIATEVLIFTYWNGGSPLTQHMYVDDVAIATSASPPTNMDASGNPFIGTG